MKNYWPRTVIAGIMGLLLIPIGAGSTAPTSVGQPASVPPPSKLLLVEDGRAQCSIVLSAQATEREELAAHELQLYLQKISGAQVPIVTDLQNPRGTLILIGRNRISDHYGLKTQGLGPDGYLIWVVGSDLVLRGETDQGTLNLSPKGEPQ